MISGDGARIGKNPRGQICRTRQETSDRSDEVRFYELRVYLMSSLLVNDEPGLCSAAGKHTDGREQTCSTLGIELKENFIYPKLRRRKIRNLMKKSQTSVTLRTDMNQ